jgi:hypothetical protein
LSQKGKVMAEQAKKPIIIKHYSGGELVGLIFRRIVCLCSAGIIFPLSWAEDVDATAYDAQYQLESDKHKPKVITV